MVKLEPLNDSGVRGTAKFMIKNGEFVAMVNAVGLVPDMLHPQHIHGFGIPSTQDAVCPPPEAAGEDGVLTIGEGLPFYGPVQLPLDGNLSNTETELETFPMPTNQGGAIHYRQVISLSELGIDPANLDLTERAVVLHGVEGNIFLPVACGEVTRVN